MKDCYIARSPMVAARQLGGEMVIMSATDSTLFTLNEVASLIWKSPDATTPLSEIVKGKVCPEFGAGRGVPPADADRLVRGLGGRGLLLVTNGPATPSPAEAERGL